MTVFKKWEGLTQKKWEGLTWKMGRTDLERWEGLTQKMRRSGFKNEKNWTKIVGRTSLKNWEGLSQKVRWLEKWENLTLNMEGLSQNNESRELKRRKSVSNKEITWTPHSQCTKQMIHKVIFTVYFLISEISEKYLTHFTKISLSREHGVILWKQFKW